jgi:hypothetical protein
MGKRTIRIELYGDRSGYLGTHDAPKDVLTEMRRLARDLAETNREAVEARAVRGDAFWFATRHVPGVTHI